MDRLYVKIVQSINDLTIAEYNCDNIINFSTFIPPEWNDDERNLDDLLPFYCNNCNNCNHYNDREEDYNVSNKKEIDYSHYFKDSDEDDIYEYTDEDNDEYNNNNIDLDVLYNKNFDECCNEYYYTAEYYNDCNNEWLDECL